MPQDNGKASKQSDDATHDKARNLAENAMEAIVKGDDAQADKLLDQARKLDPTAVQEVANDLAEDAGSDPDIARKLPD
jgi:hypothetical protein